MTIGGEVLVAGSAEYESARRSQIARFDGVRPHAVVRCRVPEDVAQALAYAQDQGWHVALRSGGHCLAGRSSTAASYRCQRLGGVGVRRNGHRGAGAVSQTFDALAAAIRTIDAGCGPAVGIAGRPSEAWALTPLSGSRRPARDARAVIDDGRIVGCDEHTTRTGSGRCGGPVAASRGVTQLVLRKLRIPKPRLPPAVAVDRGDAVIGAWQAWAPDAPTRSRRPRRERPPQKESAPVRQSSVPCSNRS